MKQFEIEGIKQHLRRDPLSGLNLEISQWAGGPSIALCRRPGFRRAFFSVAIPHGALDALNDGNEAIPAGGAHFLEHLCLSKPYGQNEVGPVAQLERLGVDFNAYTDYDRTVYYLSCVEHFEEAIHCLLEAISEPQLDVATIERERQVIARELDMVLEGTDARCYQELMGKLFEHHGLKEDVAGSKASIQALSAQDLKHLHRRLYRFEDMKLLIVGDVDQDALLHHVFDIEQRLKEKGDTGEKASSCHHRHLFPTPLATSALDLGQIKKELSAWREQGNLPSFVQRSRIEDLDPYFILGLSDVQFEEKAEPEYGYERLRWLLAADLLLGMRIGSASQIHQELIGGGLIHDSFYFQTYAFPDTRFILLGGPSIAPATVTEALIDAMTSEAHDREEDFERRKRLWIGHYLNDCDGIESLGQLLTDLRLETSDRFMAQSALETLSLEEAKAQLRPLFERARAQLILGEPSGFLSKMRREKGELK